MAKTVKKISVSKLDAMIKEKYSKTITFEWNGVEVELKPFLNMNDMLEFVDSVVKSSFSASSGEYMPEVKDFAIRMNTISRYSNFALPSSVDHQYEVVMCSGVYEMIIEHINQDQFSSIYSAINEKIRYICDSHSTEIAQKFDRLYEEFEGFYQSVAKVFNGVSAEDIHALTESMTSGGFNTDKVVESYLKVIGSDRNNK